MPNRATSGRCAISKADCSREVDRDKAYVKQDWTRHMRAGSENAFVRLPAAPGGSSAQDDERVEVDARVPSCPEDDDLDLVRAGDGPAVLVEEAAIDRRGPGRADGRLEDAIDVDPEGAACRRRRGDDGDRPGIRARERCGCAGRR